MTRRNKGEGSIHRLEGRRGYRAQVTLSDRRRVTKQFRTSTAAAAWIRQMTNKDALGRFAAASPITLSEWMETYFEERAQTKRPATLAVERSHWRTHFGPIAGVRLTDLDHLTIRRWLERLEGSLVTPRRPDGQPHTVRVCYSLLRTALSTAVDRELLAANPMTKVKRPSVPRPQPKYLRPEELKLVLDHLASTRDPRELAVQLMVRLGLRRGEALGLTWQDVDLETGRISVTLQLQWIPDPRRPGCERLERVPLKTQASRRVVRASGGLLQRLRELHDVEQPAGACFVVMLNGEPVDPQLMTRWLSNRSKEIGIPCSPHRLRHTAATLMLNEVGSISTVSTFLGHTDLKTTSVYARVLNDTSEAATLALSDAVDRLQGP